MKRIILFIAVILIFVATASANRTRAIAALPPFETGSDCLDPNVRKPQTISLGRIASRVIDIPRPDYPVEAKEAKLSGVITALVVVDETGKVIWGACSKWSSVVAGGCEDGCVSGSVETL